MTAYYFVLIAKKYKNFADRAMVDKEQVIQALRATLISVKGALTIKQCNSKSILKYNFILLRFWLRGISIV